MRENIPCWCGCGKLTYGSRYFYSHECEEEHIKKFNERVSQGLNPSPLETFHNKDKELSVNGSN